MSFEEAVKAMKEGKKVGLKRWGCQKPIMFKNKNPRILDLIYKIGSDDSTSEEVEYINGFECRIWHPTILEIEATDWEVVGENENWNLAKYLQISDKIHAPNNHIGESFNFNDVKKCRDLILEDDWNIYRSYEFPDFTTQSHIREFMIRCQKQRHKRFGDLE